MVNCPARCRTLQSSFLLLKYSFFNPTYLYIVCVAIEMSLCEIDMHTFYNLHSYFLNPLSPQKRVRVTCCLSKTNSLIMRTRQNFSDFHVSSTEASYKFSREERSIVKVLMTHKTICMY